MDQLKSNIANAQDEFNDQKSTLQDQAELGETAASIAAKAPVSPETVIEGVMFWRKAKATLAEYAVPVTGAVVSIIAASIAFKLYGNKNQEGNVKIQI